ncbi:MAG: flagellar basal body rod protein FlgF [Exilibacterium sp.]
MDKALYIAMTGAKHNMRAQAIHSNNLANANTDGFLADFARARSQAVYYGDGQPTRAYALTENPGTHFAPGALLHTGRDLDIAIKGDGFLAVQTADGGEAYTRAASLSIDSAGILRTGKGLPVLGNDGPIAIPAQEKIEIASDGSITARIKGEGPETLAQVDRIRFVKPDLSQLEKSADGLLRMRDASRAPVDANVRVVSGFLASSNVNPIDEFTNVLSLARQYEMQVKLMKAAEENSQASARLLQTS